MGLEVRVRAGMMPPRNGSCGRELCPWWDTEPQRGFVGGACAGKRLGVDLRMVDLLGFTSF